MVTRPAIEGRVIDGLGPESRLLYHLVGGHRFTTACDLARLTSDQVRRAVHRLGLTFDDAADKPTNLPTVVAVRNVPFDSGCADPDCGVPQDGPGRPRRGWVKVHSGPVSVWCCSWQCAASFAVSRVILRVSA